MRPKDILSAFGFRLKRPYAGWIVAEPKGIAYFKYTGKSVRELIEMIVPRPPTELCLESIKEWADECLIVAYGQIDAELLAKAAFAAYGLVPSKELIDAFVQACRDDNRLNLTKRW